MFIVPVSRHASHQVARESRQLSRLFDQGFERFIGSLRSAEEGAARSPALDVVESDASYTVTLEVPGVAKEDVKVSIDGKLVTVQAQSQRSEEKADGSTERTIYRERSVASFSRSFSLPQEVDQAESGAKLEHGVLTLTLPKRSVRSAAQLTVN